MESEDVIERLRRAAMADFGNVLAQEASRLHELVFDQGPHRNIEADSFASIEVANGPADTGGADVDR
jgi:hypothetical protein